MTYRRYATYRDALARLLPAGRIVPYSMKEGPTCQCDACAFKRLAGET